MMTGNRTWSEMAEKPDLAAMVDALRKLRPALGAEEYGRLRAILCGGSVLLHRGETIMTVVAKHSNVIVATLDEQVARMIVDSYLGEEAWRRAFEAVDLAGSEGA